MSERKVPDQFEIEEKKYSLIGTYSYIEFLHRIDRLRILKRKRDDTPKDSECFHWNAECSAIIEQLNGGGNNE